MLYKPFSPARYGVELYRNKDEIVTSVKELDIQPRTAQYLTGYPRFSTAGATLLSRQLFDIAYPQMHRPHQRVLAGRLGGLTLTLTDIVDSHIDSPARSLEYKRKYIQSGVGLLLHGVETEDGVASDDVAFDLARGLYRTSIRRDKAGRFGSIFIDLVETIDRQLISRDRMEQLDLAREIGSTCALLGAASVEYVTEETQPQARLAAMAIGAYAQYLDHAYEIKEDVRDAAPTYATLLLEEYGDTPRNRRRAKEDLLDSAMDVYKKGIDYFDGERRRIFRSACMMIGMRYKLLKRADKIIGGRYV